MSDDLDVSDSSELVRGAGEELRVVEGGGRKEENGGTATLTHSHIRSLVSSFCFTTTLGMMLHVEIGE